MIMDAICFALSGYFMKTSDNLTDEDNNLVLAIIAGLLCVIFTVIVCVNNADAACIFISILIGTALAFKVDTINHLVSAVLLIIILLIIGVPNISWFCLILCTFAVYLDEKGNDSIDKKEEELGDLTLFDKLLKYRYITKVTVLALSFLGLINILVPNTFLNGLSVFEPITIVYFYLFDLGYEFSSQLTDGFKYIFQSILRRF